MAKRGKVHRVRKNDFAFLGLLKCASCGASITAEKQKGHHYYRCTKKKGVCQEKHYLREEILIEQITSYLQKVSLSSQDAEKVLAALDSEQDKARESAQGKVIFLKEQLSQVEVKLQKLLDIYLAATRKPRGLAPVMDSVRASCTVSYPSYGTPAGFSSCISA